MAYDSSPDIVDSKSVGVLTVNVEYDQYRDNSPRDWCNAGTFITAHRRYNSPDEFNGSCVFEHLASEFDIYKWDREYREHELEDDPQVIFDKANKLGVVVPVYMYDHSGVSYRASTGGNPFHCRWDSGLAGVIYMTKADVLKEWGKPGAKNLTPQLRAKAEACMTSEVDTYSSWASGDVYCFTVEYHGETIASCHGYIGEDDYAMTEGVGEAEAILRYASKQRAASLARLIRNRVPLYLRSAILHTAFETAILRSRY